LVHPIKSLSLSAQSNSCERNKNLEPDDFNFIFYQRCWDTLHDEVCEMICEFYFHAKLPNDFLFSLIALMPKKDNPHIVRVQTYIFD